MPPEVDAGGNNSEPVPRPDFRQRKQQLIAAMLGVSLVTGMLAARFAQGQAGQIGPFDLFGALTLFALGFWWLHLDGRETGTVRTPLFNVGIVLLAIVFVPLYFVNARPAGHRALPILLFFGLVIASSVVSAVGALLVGGGVEAY